MKLLIISTCKYKLHEEEFVRPIIEIVDEFGCEYKLFNYHNEIICSNFNGIIICGTALLDYNYLKYIENFRNLIKFKGYVLGICSGYQIIALLYGNKLTFCRKIGLYKVKVARKNLLTKKKEFIAYFLHTYSLNKVNEYLIPIAYQDDEVCIFKVKRKNFYGVSFHPEVLNKEVIVNFLESIKLKSTG